MNRYPAWKYGLVLMAVLFGFVYALPNVFGEDPAVQISTARATEQIDGATLGRVEEILKTAKLTYKSALLDATGVAIRFADTETQLQARDLLGKDLGENYSIALNLLPSTPGYLRALLAEPMNLGLDLRGGVYLLMQVDLREVEKKSMERFVDDLRAALREARIRYRTIEPDPPNGVQIRFLNAEAKQSGADLVYSDFRDLSVDEEAAADAETLRLNISEMYLQAERESALEQNLTTLRNRVDEFGVAEPVIQKRGESRIEVQLPGVADPNKAKEIIGSTATLEFRMVDTENSVQDAVAGRVPASSALYRDRQGNPVLLSRRIMLTGESINNAMQGFDQQTGGPIVNITLDGAGAQRFARATRDEVGNPMATVFIEQKGGRPVAEVINVATIREQLGQRFQISGLDSPEEARTLALLLRAGSLAAPVEIIEERTVGPSLGADNIRRGFRSTWVGFAAISAFMIVYYLVFGLFSVLALAVNVLLLIALLSLPLLGATLTLPGMAGIALTIGMAIDANVLINERIREELRNGNTPQASIHAGYERAFGTILDSNLTTLIAGIALLAFGSGSIQGFAVVLCLGILTSMFSAVMVSRAMVNLYYGRRRRLARIAIGNTGWQ
jgi:preprotein translocase subunit SecD